MKSRILKTALCCVLVFCLVSAPAYAATVGGGVVKADVLNLRSRATTASDIIATIPYGSFVLVEEDLGGWYRVSYNGTRGYVSGDYINFAQALDGAYNFAATVNGMCVRMRYGAGTSYGIAANYDIGERISVLGVNGAWLKIRNSSGTEGYMHSDYVRYCTAQAEAIVQYDLASQVVATSKDYLGCRYVWGGMSPSGFDCSGFVNYVYNLYGYSMYRVAQDIYNYDGSWVDYNNLRQGDLVFFGTSGYNVTHVGMYIGGGEFIHACSSDTGVIISSLESGYYAGRFVGAKRIIN